MFSLYYHFISTIASKKHSMEHSFLVEVGMTQVTLFLEPAVALFYTRIAETLGIPLEQVLSDALFKLAGELSLEALQ